MNDIQLNKSDLLKPGGVRELLILAVPMIISTACDGVMTFTDRLFLARVGSAEMNASLGGSVALQVLMFFFAGLIGYSAALVAQYFGAGEKNSTSKVTFQAMLITLVAWPVILLLAPFAKPVFVLMGLPPEQLDFQVQYLNVLAIGSLFLLMRHTLGCYFTGIGKTKIVMIATLVAMVVNVVLDYIFIFGKLGFPAMGVKGAAIATVAGALSASLILLMVYLGKRNRLEFSVMRSFRFDKAVMYKLIHYGYPAGLEFFLNFLAFSVMIMLFHGRGEVAATATTIMFNWDMVSFIPLLGVEIAVTSLVGRYMGAQRPEAAQRAAFSAIRTGIYYSASILILFLFIPETLVHVFRPEQADPVFDQSVPIAVTMIRMAALYVLIEAVMVALVGALRGAGDTHYTMIVSVAAHWLFIPILYLSLNVFSCSIELSWFIIVVFYLLVSSILIFRFRSGKWKKIKVIDAIH